MTFVIFALIILVSGYFLFRKKKNPVATSELTLLPYQEILNQEVDFYQQLDEAHKNKFESLVKEFLAYVRIEGVGTNVTDLDKVLIASSAIIPVFGFPEWKYKNLTNVILYPDTFDKDFQFDGAHRSILGMVGSGYMNGQMLLSREALTKGFSTASGKENAAIHEFVHLLDKSDGATDGIPENLLGHEYAVPWLKMMHQEMHRIQVGASDINPYALTSEAEFLAVASEYFFEKPEKFQHMNKELYHMLSMIFNQDPESSKII
ncbi:MAG: zinc-dependent peptidase [Sphingobacteriaceae bacterium]